ncbi:ring canal kelch homolog [Anopheles bellator]|uniref:ring canal kelch homolog n=1 Tax=Anopheles bellator TaxID=139047 RepID=UPI002647B51D|nr:ring canal kelch homolog [Anopheles bellator]
MSKPGDNLYERVREEPAYQNTGSLAANRGLFGRFDVIGHGVGRIERHLSSSCGNIDHYSLGGHYAVLGHSHLGTVGHIRLNQPNTGGNVSNSTCTPNQPNSTKDGSSSSSSVNVKSFFSCLGGENSQSMNNLNKPSANGEGVTAAREGEAIVTTNQGSSIVGGLASAAAVSATTTATGTIPKINRKTKQSHHAEPSPGGSSMVGAAVPLATPPPPPPPAELPCGELASGGGGRVTKPSLQWLLVNKWLPMWVGQTPPDYKFIDFNFMFSRNCDGCASAGGGTHARSQQELVRYGHSPIADYIPPAREYPTMTGSYPRVLRNTPQLARLREHEYENIVPSGDGATPNGPMRHASRATRPVAGSVGRLREQHQHQLPGIGADPFRTWAFNFEDNSFRPARTPNGAILHPAPAVVRRITDGTFGAKELQPDQQRPGPSGLQSAAAGTVKRKGDENENATRRLSTASLSSSDSDNYVMESLATEVGGLVADDSSPSGEFQAPGEQLDKVAHSKDGGNGAPSSSNDSSESVLNYEPEVAETADRSLSEDEVEVVVCEPNDSENCDEQNLDDVAM